MSLYFAISQEEPGIREAGFQNNEEVNRCSDSCRERRREHVMKISDT